MLLFAINHTLHDRAWYESWSFWAMTMLIVWCALCILGPWVKAHNPNDPRTKHTPPD